MKSNKIVLGVAAGLATGLLLGVLFAPHKGSTNQKKNCSCKRPNGR
jgi:gas vesicle protein